MFVCLFVFWLPVHRHIAIYQLANEVLGLDAEGLWHEGKDAWPQASRKGSPPCLVAGDLGACVEETGCVRGRVSGLCLEKVRQAANAVWWKEP